MPIPFRTLREAIINWWDAWVNWVVIGLVWMLCWLTIVLGPPATFSLYHLAHRSITGEAPDARNMFEGGKLYFLKSWGWFLSIVFVVAIVVGNIYFYTGIAQTWAVFLRSIIAIIGIIWLGLQFYALPFFMIQESKSILMAWRNSSITALTSLGYTLMIWLAIGVIIIPCIITLIPFFLGAPALIAVIGSQAIHDQVALLRSSERNGNF